MMQMIASQQVPARASSRLPGRSLSYAFSKGGAETTRLMNVVNIPMQGSVVVKKMTAAAKVESDSARSQTRGTKTAEVGLIVKKFLSNVEGLDIQMKDKEKEKLGLGATPGDSAPQAPSDAQLHQSDARDQDGKASDADKDTAEPEDQAAGEPAAKKAKIGKAERKRSLFKGYDEERASYSTIALATSGESRPITALDDIMAALQFVVRKMGSIADESKLLASYAFCLGLFFEFAWQGRVSLNGREFRQYSALRTELQQAMLDANDLLQACFASPSDAQGQGPGRTGKDKKQSNVSPLELAQMLCKSFHSLPVTQVVWGEEDAEEQTMKNILVVMLEQREALVEPLTSFLAKDLPLPLVMHQAVQTSLKQIATLPADSNRQLVDVLSIVFDTISEYVPSSWMGFAFDCVGAHADHGHFVENTQEAPQTLLHVFA